jgi:hypothetical protein
MKATEDQGQNECDKIEAAAGAPKLACRLRCIMHASLSIAARYSNDLACRVGVVKAGSLVCQGPRYASP